MPSSGSTAKFKLGMYKKTVIQIAGNK